MKWLNALALILQFISFWFAAPEILGEQTLRRIGDALKKFVSNLSLFITLIIVAGYGITFSAMGILKGMQASENNIPMKEMINYYIFIGIATLIYFIFIFYYKKIRSWFDTKFSSPLVEKLMNDENMRKNSLLTGAFLFTLGFLIQLFTTLFQPG